MKSSRFGRLIGPPVVADDLQPCRRGPRPPRRGRIRMDQPGRRWRGRGGARAGSRSVARCEWRCMSCQPSACSSALRFVPSDRNPALSATPQEPWFSVECASSILRSPTRWWAHRTSARVARVATCLLRADGSTQYEISPTPAASLGYSVIRPRTVPSGDWTAHVAAVSEVQSAWVRRIHASASAHSSKRRRCQRWMSGSLNASRTDGTSGTSKERRLSSSSIGTVG